MDAHVALDIFSHFYDACGGPRGDGGTTAAATLDWCRPLVDLNDRKAARKLASTSAMSAQSTPIDATTTATATDVTEYSESPGHVVDSDHVVTPAFDSQELLARLAALGILGPAARLVPAHDIQTTTQLPLVCTDATGTSATGAPAVASQPLRVKSLALFANGSPVVVVLASVRALQLHPLRFCNKLNRRISLTKPALPTICSSLVRLATQPAASCG